MTIPGAAAPLENGQPEAFEIPEAEKIAAQWEARHDLAARGRTADPMHVQQYLAHVRSEETLSHADHTRAEARRAAPGLRPAPLGVAAVGETEPADHGGWRRWLRPSTAG